MTKKWKKYEGEGDSYALCLWEFRKDPHQCNVIETANTLSRICALIPAHSMAEERKFDVVHIGQWLTDGVETIPHPSHITTLYSIVVQEDDPSEEDDD